MTPAGALPVPDDALLEVRELVVRYPGRKSLLRPSRPSVTAVKGISFYLRRGETLGLVGESGCGKSTTARAVLGLIGPTSGRVLFDGADVGKMEREERRRFRRRAQIVFQDPYGSLNPRLTVGEALDEVLRVHRIESGAAERRRRVGRLLERVGLRPDHAGRRPHEFSGGQRQRIGIARALAVEPELLVCDEPVSALDVSVQARILDLLADLQREMDLAYLLIAHDLAVVRHMSDRLAVMYGGRIVETGDAEALYRRPLHPYTGALLAAVPRLEDGVPGEGDRRSPIGFDDASPASGPPDGCPFYPRCPHPGKDAECLEAVPPLERKAGTNFAACVKVASRPGGDEKEPEGLR